MLKDFNFIGVGKGEDKLRLKVNESSPPPRHQAISTRWRKSGSGVRQERLLSHAARGRTKDE